MDFLYSIHHISELWSFTKYVFSIGTYEGDYFEQLMFPLNTIEDTIIFAIDEKYHLLDKTVSSIEIDGLKYLNISKKTKLTSFYNKIHNTMIIFIDENIRSSYNEKGITHSDFLYTLECKPETKDWLIFERFLLQLIDKNKKIYINNWAFFNTRYFEEVNKKVLYRYRDTGHYFEYFPEVGYIVFNIYKLYPQSKLYITLYEKVQKIDSIIKNSIKNIII